MLSPCELSAVKLTMLRREAKYTARSARKGYFPALDQQGANMTSIWPLSVVLFAIHVLNRP
jgi:hypothetical protein